ncbi:GTP 3',8-cyclase MoaA [Erythrobacter alti]|uniref:GTP 3',8-cyclase MoaA n=1 Tax=Erythrobacter alti TaxID=1896145 RepID=UPI0030F3E3BB
MSCATPLTDSFDRRISYLRLSVTDRCDLRCAYCMPERMQFLPKSEVLTLEEIYRLALAFVARGVAKIRLTGGEPLVRRDVMDLVRALGRKLGDGLEELTLTTNGTQLAEYAQPLFDAGVRRVNVSLDTRDPDLFAQLTRRDRLAQVLEGIAAAKAAGLRVKINTVALKGLNEAEIPQLVEWSHAQGHDLTLIEVMPMGDVDGERIDHYLPLPAVRDQLEQHFALSDIGDSTGGPARYVRVAETGRRIGFISPLTNNFCATCNRVRVTATGQLYACLGGAEKVDLRAALRSDQPEAALATALDEAMRIKPERHHFAIARGAAPAQPRHMSVTGG